MPDYAALFTAASELPVDQRMRLIDELYESLPDQSGELPLSQEWLEEIERRSAKYEAGEAKLEDWESVRERLFHRVNVPREA